MGDNDVDATARAAITERNARESPLLRLPPELHNHIWHYVIDRNMCNFVTNTNGEYYDWTVALKNPQAHRRALLRVCRQIHHETANFPVTFTITFDLMYGLIIHIKSLSERLRSVVDEMHVIVPLTGLFHCVCTGLVLYEKVPSLMETLPNLKRVKIDYINPPDEELEEGQDFAYIAKCKKSVDNWLYRDRQGMLEVVVKESVAVRGPLAL